MKRIRPYENNDIYSSRQLYIAKNYIPEWFIDSIHQPDNFRGGEEITVVFGIKLNISSKNVKSVHKPSDIYDIGIITNDKIGYTLRRKGPENSVGSSTLNSDLCFSVSFEERDEISSIKIGLFKQSIKIDTDITTHPLSPDILYGLEITFEQETYILVKQNKRIIAKIKFQKGSPNSATLKLVYGKDSNSYTIA